MLAWQAGSAMLESTVSMTLTSSPTCKKLKHASLHAGHVCQMFSAEQVTSVSPAEPLFIRNESEGGAANLHHSGACRHDHRQTCHGYPLKPCVSVDSDCAVKQI